MIGCRCTFLGRQLLSRKLISSSNSYNASVVRHPKQLILAHFFGSAATVPRPTAAHQYAIVDHEEAYFENMEGRHGKQLSLAYNNEETTRKKDKYLPDDLLDLFQLQQGNKSNNNQENTNDIPEAEIVNNDDDEEEEDDDNFQELSAAKYKNDGSVRFQDPSELEAYKQGAPAGGMFAVIHLAGSQHKVAVDDVVIVNKLLPVTKWKVGTTITLDSTSEVLLIGSQQKTIVGLSPGIPNAIVKVMVEEITHDKTVIVFKKKRRKNYRRKNGFRREVTMLRILDIQMPPEASMEGTISNLREESKAA